MVRGMSSVWAYRDEKEFGFVWGTNRYGYDHLIRFGGMHDLLDQLAAAELRDKVWRLSLVAHGDSPGVVQLTRGEPLSTRTLNRYDAMFRSLALFLTPDATVSFVSCIAGSGPEGSELLRRLSLMLPTRYVVGFTQWGVGMASGVNQPGALFQSSSPVGMVNESHPHRLDVDCRFAKIVRNGVILRQPVATDQA